jgi:hypothetical protein
LAYERAAAGPGLHGAQKLERPQGFPNRSARDLELLGKLALRGKLVTGAKIAPLQETFDLLDDALIKAAAADRLDDGQGPNLPEKASGQVVRPDVARSLRRAAAAVN